VPRVINTTSSIDTVTNGINDMSLSNNNNATKEVGIIADSNIPGMSTSNKKVKGASKSNDNTLEVIGQLQNMSTADNNVSVCANCGKEGAKNICNKCKKATYCNAVCKKVHKKKHKKQCEEYVKLATEKHNEELRLAAEKHDEVLFKQPPPLDDCPICFLQLPFLDPTGKKYMTCCGKRICSGCCYAPLYDNQGNEVDNQKCPFCRAPWPDTEEEIIKRYKIRMEAGDPIAIFNIGMFYRDGKRGKPQDYTKALELFHRARDLGHPEAYGSIGFAYMIGEGVDIDEKKGKHYYELGAMDGDTMARHNLGINEEEAGNTERALKHYMIAVRNGHDDSLKEIQDLFTKGHATKEDYTEALQSYQAYLMEIKSAQRDKAAAYSESYRYY